MDRRAFLNASLATTVATTLNPAHGLQTSEYCYYLRPAGSDFEAVIRPKQAQLPPYYAAETLTILRPEPTCHKLPQNPEGTSWVSQNVLHIQKGFDLKLVSENLEAQGVPKATFHLTSFVQLRDRHEAQIGPMKDYYSLASKTLYLPQLSSEATPYVSQYILQNFREWAQKPSAAHFQVLIYDLPNQGFTLDVVLVSP